MVSIPSFSLARSIRSVRSALSSKLLEDVARD